MYFSAVSKDDRKEAPGNSASGAASPADRAQSPFMPITPAVDQEALITIEFEKFSPNCPSNSSPTETLQIATIQFNNLDLIGKSLHILTKVKFRVIMKASVILKLYFMLNHSSHISQFGKIALIKFTYHMYHFLLPFVDVRFNLQYLKW